jgi:hypothetical protein
MSPHDIVEPLITVVHRRRLGRRVGGALSVVGSRRSVATVAPGLLVLVVEIVVLCE